MNKPVLKDNITRKGKGVHMTPNKEASSTPEGVLVKLKSKMCADLGIDPYKLKILVDRFIVTTLKGSITSRTHFAKVNTYNDLSKDKMTIKVFFKFLRILNVKSARISLTIKTVKDTEHTVFQDINLFNTPEDD